MTRAKMVAAIAACLGTLWLAEARDDLVGWACLILPAGALWAWADLHHRRAQGA